MVFMFFLLLPLVIVFLYVVATTYVGYRRGTLAFSPPPTRSEKNLRHLATFLTAAVGLALVLGLSYADVLDDRGYKVASAVVVVIGLLRSILIELGLHRVDGGI